jgi:hypothetical protein
MRYTFEIFLKAIYAVSLHIHHSIDKTLSILILLILKKRPIFSDRFIPFSGYICLV